MPGNPAVVAAEREEEFAGRELADVIRESFEGADFISDDDVRFDDWTPTSSLIVPYDVSEPAHYVSFEEIKRRLGEL